MADDKMKRLQKGYYDKVAPEGEAEKDKEKEGQTLSDHLARLQESLPHIDVHKVIGDALASAGEKADKYVVQPAKSLLQKVGYPTKDEEEKP
jgi:hypothetical protein